MCFLEVKDEGVSKAPHLTTHRKAFCHLIWLRVDLVLVTHHPVHPVVLRM